MAVYSYILARNAIRKMMEEAIIKGNFTVEQAIGYVQVECHLLDENAGDKCLQLNAHMIFCEMALKYDQLSQNTLNEIESVLWDFDEEEISKELTPQDFVEFKKDVEMTRALLEMIRS